MPGKDHGMKGKANASKGRENWPRTNVQIDPDQKAEIQRRGVPLVDAINQALSDWLKKK